MIGPSASFVNVSLPHLLSKLAVIVFCEVGKTVMVGFVDTIFFYWEEQKYVKAFLLILGKMVAMGDLGLLVYLLLYLDRSSEEFR